MAEKLTAKQIGEEIVATVKDFVARSLSPLITRLAGIEERQASGDERLAALERRIDALERGGPSKDKLQAVK